MSPEMADIKLENADFKLTKKDIAKSIKTVLVALQAMRSKQIRITLRNDQLVTGTLLKVDGSMNAELANVSIEDDSFFDVPNKKIPIKQISTDDTSENSVLVNSLIETQQSEKQIIDRMIVKGTKIRHIEILDDCNIIDLAKKEITRLRNRNKSWSKRDIIKI